jgi:hypothetical protein
VTTGDEVVPLLTMRLCSYREAARTLRMPPSTLWWWLEGREEESYEPVLRSAPTGSNVMTCEFVEAAYLREYRRRSVPLRRLRLFVEALRDELRLPHPLATKQPFIAAEHRLVLELEERVELAGELRAVVVDPTDGQLVLSYPAEAFLEKVEFAEVGAMPALRWFPAGKQSPDDYGLPEEELRQALAYEWDTSHLQAA